MVRSIKRSLPRRDRAEGEPSPEPQGEGHGRCEEPGSAAPKDSPAYGARNVQKGTAGTGEALPDPAAAKSAGAGGSYKR